MQAVFTQGLGQKLHGITHLGGFAGQVITGDVFVFQGQLHALGRQHAHGHREVMHRDFLHVLVFIECLGVGVAANHGDGVGIQLLQIVEVDRGVLALDEAHPVEQVLRRELAYMGALFAVPGVDQHVIAALTDAQHRPGPGHLFEISGIASPRQGRADDIGRQATVDQRRISEGWPSIGDQPQPLCAGVVTQQQQPDQSKSSMQSRHAKHPWRVQTRFVFCRNPKDILGYPLLTLAH